MAKKRRRSVPKLVPRLGPATNLRPAGPHEPATRYSRKKLKAALRREVAEGGFLVSALAAVVLALACTHPALAQTATPLPAASAPVAAPLPVPPARSATPSPAPPVHVATPSPATFDFTSADVAALLKATAAVQNSPKITVLIETPPSMPRYDPLVHYAGINGKGQAVVWVARTLMKSKMSIEAYRAAMEMVCMDTGFAGPKWKAIYAHAAALDAALPASEKNRYLNRLALTAAIQSAMNASLPF